MATSNRVEVEVATGDELDVRTFAVHEAMDQLFRVEVTAVSKNLEIKLDQVIGLSASFTLGTASRTHALSGIAIEMKQVRVDARGLATYALVIAPVAWRMTQR